jgi:hypothetical protein
MRVSPPDDVKRRLWEWVPVVLTGCAGLLVFHRATVLSGFDIVQADVGDSRLVVFLLEHWHRVFTWDAEWTSPSMFYPVKGVLGYTEMLFGTGVFYTLFRSVGLDLFQATNATLVLLSLLAYVCAYWLLRRVLQASQFGSIAGAFFFAFAYPKFAQLAHLQLRFDFFQPLALGVIAPALLETRAMGPRELATRASIFAALVCLAASTAFYNAWFFVFFAGLSAVVAVVASRAVRNLIVMRLHEARRVWWIPLVLCAVLLTPFLILYLPALKLGTQRTWEHTAEYLPHLSNYFWLGPEHFLWGTLRFNSSEGVAYPIESHLGFGVGVTSLVFVGWAWAIWHLVRSIRRSHAWSSPWADWLSAMLVSSLIVTVLTVRWGPFSAWRAVYEFVPGASVMVGVGRWALTLALPVSILIAVVIGRLQQRWQRRYVPISALVLAAAFIAIEQAGRIPTAYSAAVASRYHRELLQVVPASCEAFLLAPRAESTDVPIIGRRDFDEAKYLADNPDVAKNWPGNPWEHYSQIGYREKGRGFESKAGARRYFDEAKYLAANPDVAKNWPGSGWDHYWQIGYREGRGLDPEAAARRVFLNLHYHLSAMIVSALSGKPTVNGASGLQPRDYPSNLYHQDISQHLDEWISHHPGTHACLIAAEITPDVLADRGRGSPLLEMVLSD